MITEVKKGTEYYLQQFEKTQKESFSSEPSWLVKHRQTAIERFAGKGFPSVKDEEWKYTNVAPLTAIPFVRNGFGLQKISPQIISSLVPGAYANPLLVFINGHFSPELSKPEPLPPGVTLSSLSSILKENPELVEPHLASHARIDANAFTALNTAFMEDGAFVHLPLGTVVKTPIYLLFVSTGENQAIIAHPRNLIVAGENSQATIIESYVGLGSAVYFTNAVTEVLSSDYSVINHYKIQEESLQAFHVATLHATQSRSSNFSSHNIALGSALGRNDIIAKLDAEGCECTLNGLYLGATSQHLDSHTHIDHLKPHGTSRQLYKGILDGKSRGIFNGKVVVHKGANKTDAQQTNKNLLLSDQAEADPTPQLEIFADDVKVSHGSTVGQLDKNQIFYLRSRGLSEGAAKSLLTYAFASDIIDRIRVEALKSRLKETLIARLPDVGFIGPIGPIGPI